MALNSFLSKQGHSVIIDAGKIPDEGYIRAIRIRNIVNFRLMNKDEKASPGCPDVIVESLFGEKRIITRNDLIDNYVFITGKKISIAGVKRNVYYKAMAPDNTEVFYLIVPENAVAVINNNKVPKGSVITILSNGNGELDRNSIKAMAMSTFKKMCVTPYNDRIRKNASSKYRIFTIYDKKLMEKNKPNSYKIWYSKLKPSNSFIRDRENKNINKQRTVQNKQRPIINNQQEIRPSVQDQAVQNNIQRPVNNEYIFIAVRKIIDNNNKIIGFVLRNRKGVEKPIDFSTVIRMCEEKKIKNLMISSRTTSNGGVTRYIKGNGISIDQLPIERR